MGLTTFGAWIVDRLRKQKGAVQSGPQCPCGRNVAFQVGNNGSTGNDFPVSRWNIPANHQGNADYTIQMGKAWRAVEIDHGQRNLGEWNANAPDIQRAGSDMGDYGCGIISHDGSFKLFKWDGSKGCMVPLQLSNRGALAAT